MNLTTVAGSDIAGPLILTLKLAALTTVLLLILATPVAWWLAHSTRRWKPLVQAVVALPIVLPPTVLGFYLLILLGPRGAVGGWWVEMTGQTLTFSFAGLVIASCLYSLPFAVQPLQAAFAQAGLREVEAARTLGAGPFDAFLSVAVPLAAPGFVAAAVLSFAHTLGEFGVVLMVGGNIPGETRVVSIAIFDHVEALNYGAAHELAAILLAFAFAVLVVMFVINRRWAYR